MSLSPQQDGRKKEAATSAHTPADFGVTFSTEMGEMPFQLGQSQALFSVMAGHRATPRSFDIWMLRAQIAPLETFFGLESKWIPRLIHAGRS